ncbi:PH domain-containing protein [Falsibacillus albus]|uniref:YdbS-like PH domain-containing protein n=1 Tax=Falsibacillus albus TaxID=2478915 RepID=A0A3L7JQS7_9BACI|nr:PH domain-containing protein [Falsibacillus albus]RLQ93178.1 hypothetical protein D9X91_18260 [Falsibacillus albus]
MRGSEPSNRVSPKALTVWRMEGMIYSLICLIIFIAGIAATIKFDWPKWPIAAGAALVIVCCYIFGFLFPYIKWKRWRYEVRDQEIELQHGMVFIKRTLVPMVRVQHVDTVQGPLLRKYHLSTITISTAATIHHIPAIETVEADDLRASISRLARVAEDDV